MARVWLPSDPDVVADILGMYSYCLADGSEFANFEYQGGIAHLPPNPTKLRQVATALGYGVSDLRADGAPLAQPFERAPGWELRDYQLQPARELYRHIKNYHSGTLSAGCGTGKTVVMTLVGGYLQRKILVLLDQSNLVDNWEDAFRKFWGRELQHINSKTTTFGDCCISTFQLLHKNPELLGRMSREFGTLLIDEAHTVKANTFRDVMLRLDAKYRVGCSATYFAKGLPQGILDDLIAPVCVTMVDNNALTPTVHMVRTGVTFASEDPNAFTSETLPGLAMHDGRNMLFFRIILEMAAKGRRILVIAIKTAQTHLLHQMLLQAGVVSTVYVGGTSKKRDKQVKEDFNAGRLQVVITCKKLDKGTDLASADVLVTGKPCNNLTATQQQSGRVVRQWEGKPQPLIFDLADEGGLARRYAHNRKRWYAKLGYEVVDPSPLFP